MIDRIGHLVSDVGGSLELLRSKLMQGQITPQEAELARIRIERLKKAKATPVEGGTVVDKGIQQLMAQGQQPSMDARMQAPEEVAMAYGGLAELPVEMFDEASYAGGGIVAFSNGDLVEDEYQGIDYDKLYQQYIGNMPKSPVSSYFKYDVPRPETGYLKKRMERAKALGLTSLEAKKIADAEREAYGIDDKIFSRREKEVEGFKDQAEKSRDYALGAAGLQTAAALLSRPTIGLAAEEASKTAIPTLLAGQREYVRDVRDASKLAFEAGLAKHGYQTALYRDDRASANENRARFEAATDKLAAFDENFIKDISDRLKTSAESAVVYQAKVDAARANEGSVNIGHLTSAVQAKNLAVAKVDEILEKKYGSQLKQAQDILSAKNAKAKDLEWAKKFIEDYDIMRTNAINQENAILEPAIKYEANRLGIPLSEVSTLTSTGRDTATMAKPSKSTIKGDIDYSNPLLKSKS